VFWKADLLFLDAILKPFDEVFCIGKKRGKYARHSQQKKKECEILLFSVLAADLISGQEH